MMQNGGIERRQIAHEVCALSSGEEVEVGCPVDIRECFEREAGAVAAEGCSSC
jgi:hypothetical protein